MRSFEDSLNAHKSELTEALIVFGEHKRVGKALAELETQRPEFYKFYKDGQESRQNEVDELQKRVDAVKGLAQTLWEKSEEKHQQGKVWESKTLGECADEILDVLEQALKGGES